jgi:hypothetical protein
MLAACWPPYSSHCKAALKTPKRAINKALPQCAATPLPSARLHTGQPAAQPPRASGHCAAGGACPGLQGRLGQLSHHERDALVKGQHVHCAPGRAAPLASAPRRARRPRRRQRALSRLPALAHCRLHRACQRLHEQGALARCRLPRAYCMSERCGARTTPPISWPCALWRPRHLAKQHTRPP